MSFRLIEACEPHFVKPTHLFYRKWIRRPFLILAFLWFKFTKIFAIFLRKISINSFNWLYFTISMAMKFEKFFNGKWWWRAYLNWALKVVADENTPSIAPSHLWWQAQCDSSVPSNSSVDNIFLFGLPFVFVLIFILEFNLITKSCKNNDWEKCINSQSRDTFDIWSGKDGSI